MGNINEVFSGISIATMVATAFGLLKLGIDSLNLRAVEKTFLSPSKRLLIFVSQIIITSLLMFLFTVAIYVLPQKKLIDKFELMGLALIALTCTIIVFISLFVIVNVLSVKFMFRFSDDNNVKWDIEKRISKNKVLVSRENNKYFLHFDYNLVLGKELQKILVKEKKLPGHKIINEKFKYFISILFLLMLADNYFLMFIDIGNTSKVIGGILILLFYLLLIYSICVKNNEKSIAPSSD